MGLVESIKRVFGGATTVEPLAYHCEECGHEFEAGVRPMNEVTCPVCDAVNVRHVE